MATGYVPCSDAGAPSRTGTRPQTLKSAAWPGCTETGVSSRQRQKKGAAQGGNMMLLSRLLVDRL